MKFWAALLLGLLLAQPATGAQAAAEGVIEGQLHNGTGGAPSPAGRLIVLHIVGNDQRVERREGTADGEGRYRFEGLETGTALTYLPVTEYEGALYFSRPITLSVDQARQSADITVYESSPSDQWIAFERSSLLIQGVSSQRLDIMEMGSVANVGDRTYIGPTGEPGSARPTLRFPVPIGAVALAPQLGFAPNDFTPDTDGFSIQSPVLPGRHQLAFSYSLPFGSDQLEIRKRVEYPIQTYSFYVPDLGLRVESPQLQAQGPSEFGGQRFLLYTAQNLTRGTELQIRLAGLPTSAAAPPQTLALAILGVGSAAFVTGLVLVHRRRGARVPTVLKATPHPGTTPLFSNGRVVAEATEPRRMQLLVDLARLDERFERGELPAEEYERERERGKQRLVTITGRPDGAQAGVE